MKLKCIGWKLLGAVMLFVSASASRPGIEYKIFQFPRELTPGIDGDFSEWDLVPDTYIIGSDQLINTVSAVEKEQDPGDYDLKVKVGWVKGLNRLYFYLEAFDDYWDFEDPGLAQDIFELVVDADMSGGNFINTGNWVSVSIVLGSSGNSILINNIAPPLSYTAGSDTDPDTIPSDVTDVILGGQEDTLFANTFNVYFTWLFTEALL